MVTRDFVIDNRNAAKYGYTQEVLEITQFSQPVNSHDFQDWGKLDHSIPENARIANETTEHLVRNWTAHHNLGRQPLNTAENVAPINPRQSMDTYNPAPNPNRPKVNIYLRPAIKTDIPQLTAIYNWHVEHTPRTAECKPIINSDMEYRFDNCTVQKLPFIVALLRSKAAQADTVVGFTCAQDFTSPEYVERISAEVEIYVHQGWMNKGVGRCLLDQLLEATDRGHLRKGGYSFACDPEISHLYKAGGGRDLHLLVFVLRHWKTPVKKGEVARGGSRNKGNAIVAEDDYQQWLKPWLERWEFEEQGCLKGAGAKKGRL